MGVTANSIAELAKLMEVDEAALTATIERYNELAAAGNDGTSASAPTVCSP
ncbi:MAG: hypothetical protein ACLSVD_05175 [Eggerthellaceae bacterium]